MSVNAAEESRSPGPGRGSARAVWVAWSVASCFILATALFAFAWRARTSNLLEASEGVATIARLASEARESSDVVQASVELQVLANLDASDPKGASNVVQRSLRRLQARLQKSESADSRRIANEIDDRLAGRAVASDSPFLAVFQGGRLVGVQVSALDARERIATAGLVVGDVITQVGRVRVESPATARAAVDAIASGDAVKLVVRDRSGVVRAVSLPSAASRPPSP